VARTGRRRTGSRRSRPGQSARAGATGHCRDPRGLSGSGAVKTGPDRRFVITLRVFSTSYDTDDVGSIDRTTSAPGRSASTGSCVETGRPVREGPVRRQPRSLRPIGGERRLRTVSSGDASELPTGSSPNISTFVPVFSLFEAHFDTVVVRFSLRRRSPVRPSLTRRRGTRRPAGDRDPGRPRRGRSRGGPRPSDCRRCRSTSVPNASANRRSGRPTGRGTRRQA